MDAVFLLVCEPASLADFVDVLSGRGGQAQLRREPRGGEYLLCRLGSEPAWEVSVEGFAPSSLSELEEVDLRRLGEIDPRSVFLIAFRKSSVDAVRRIVAEMPWFDSAQYLRGDGTGASVRAAQFEPEWLDSGE
ncbi:MULTISPECIES: hypothetical protein [unclassified Streptomyces]|uniref:hypothetical protein n=1 Tax=unclassified Streptomyces TaxID=2593676 RepID=UPI00340EC15A